MMSSSFLPSYFGHYIFIQIKRKKKKDSYWNWIQQHLALPNLIQQCHPSFSHANTRTIRL